MINSHVQGEQMTEDNVSTSTIQFERSHHRKSASDSSSTDYVISWFKRSPKRKSVSGWDAALARKPMVQVNINVQYMSAEAGEKQRLTLSFFVFSTIIAYGNTTLREHAL